MGLFSKKKQDDANTFEKPRYKENPMHIFFENFILSVIDKLPSDKVEKLNSMNLAKVFNTEPNDWKIIIKKVLNLSDTIEIAILDLWYRNREISLRQGTNYEPAKFAMDFVDNYYEEDSKVDVWEGHSLAQAMERIRISKENEK